MKNKLIICFILLVVCIPFVGSISVSADSDDTEKKQFIYSTLSDFLDIQNIDFDSNVLISEPFEVYDFNNDGIIDNREIYFIIRGNKVIGRLAFNIVNNEFQANYLALSNSIFDNLYQNNIDFAYGFYDNNTIVLINNEFRTFDNTVIGNSDELELNCETKTITRDLVNNSFVALTLSECYSTTRSSLLFNKQLSGVTHVSNSKTPSNNGLCWAATMAMKINRESPSWSNMDADDVFWNMRIMFGEDPIGDIEWYKKGYPRFGMDNLTYKSGGMTCGQVSSAIQNNKTIHADLWTSSSAKGKKEGHSILISGIKIYSDHAIYTIYDCNQDYGMFYQYVSSQAMSNPAYFYYDNKNSIAPVLTYWKYSVY